MYDFIIGLFEKLNISTEFIDSYEKMIVVISGFSIVLFIFNKLLGKMFDKAFEAMNDGAKVNNLQVVDFGVLLINILTIFVELPKDVYAVLLVVSIIEIVLVVMSFWSKIKPLFWCFVGLFFEPLTFLALLPVVLLFLVAALCGLLQGLLTFDKAITLFRAIM